MSAAEHEPEPEGLSREELRELLGEALGAIRRDESAPEPRASGKRVLLATRRDRDADLIEERVTSHGASLEIVRNAFSALDKLRTGSYSTIVSDFDLWANDGRLLLERVAGRDEVLPIVFLVDRGRHRAPAVLDDAPRLYVLNCPLEAGELEATLRAALGLTRSATDGDASEEREALLPDSLKEQDLSDAGEPVEEEPTVEDLSADDLLEGEAMSDGAEGAVAGELTETPEFASEEAAARPADLAELPPQKGPEAALGELSWLRFLVKGYRFAHQESVSAAALARLAADELGALAVGVLWRQGSRTAAHLESQAGTDSLLFKRVLDAVRAGDGGEKGLVLKGGDATLAILGLPPPFRTAAGPYADDLRCLLEAWSAALD